jgi:hypothetical protein
MEKEKSTNTLEQDIKPNVVADKVYSRGKTDYYLFHDLNNASNVFLSIDTLRLIKERTDKYVICADALALSKSDLKRYNIKFYRLPCDWEKIPKTIRERINAISPRFEQDWIESTQFTREYQEKFEEWLKTQPEENGKENLMEETKKQLELNGVDNWDRPVYQDESGQLWKDVNLGRGEPDLHSAVNNDFYGEPDMPIKGEFEIINTQPKKSNTLQEARQGLNEEVENTLQFFIDSDMENHGALSPDTLETIKVQGYEYNGVNLVQITEQPETPKSIYYPINEETARQAKQANSFYDYKQGSATAGYQASVDKAVEIAEKQKKHVDPQYHDKIDRFVDTYARKLAANINHRNAIDCRVPSIMISGGSNFPVRKKEKQNAARDTNMREWSDIQGLLDKIKSVGMGGISADDPNAINRLQEKLESLQDSQETMKAVNAYYRKHKTLDGCPHLSEKNLATLKADMSRNWLGRASPKPFESYALSNNSANIRNVKERIEQLKSKEKIEFTGWQFDGGNVKVNKQDNRLQVFFDEKPDVDTRTELKKNGFKWSPNAGAWQRQLTDNAFWGANYVKAIQPLTGEKPTDLYRAARAEAKQEQPAEPAHQPEQAAAPTLAELDKAVNNGEQISLLDLSNAIKKEGLSENLKPKSINARIEADRIAKKTAPEESAPTKKKAKSKSEIDL